MILSLVLTLFYYQMSCFMAWSTGLVGLISIPVQLVAMKQIV